MKKQRGFIGLGMMIAILVGLAIIGGGAYYAAHQSQSAQVASDSAATTTSAQVQQTPTQTQTVTSAATQVAAPIAVPGMSQYTDSDFGFSVWIPSAWSMKKQTAANMLNSSDYQGGTLSAAWDFSGSVAGRIDEYTSPGMSITLLGQPLGYNYNFTLYFDTTNHTWMTTKASGGLAGSPGANNAAADVSNNTMGGLHMISALGETIVPLSAHNFLIIHSEGRNYLDGITKTIVATNPAVATPISAAAQTQVVQTEYNNYVVAAVKCQNMQNVGGLTIQDCLDAAVRGQ